MSSCGTCLSWDFSNGVQGWQMLDPSNTTQYLTAESGRLVLHNPNPDYGNRTYSTFVVYLCGDHYALASTNGYTLTAKIDILNTLISQDPANSVYILGNNGKFVTVQELSDPTGYQWFTLSGTLTANSSMVGIALDLGDTLTGTVLVEEVTLTPP